MSVLICDFMGDKTLTNIAENICKQKPNLFSHHISHTLPAKKSHLSNLQFIDATLLYRLENLEKAFPDISPKPISFPESRNLKECLELFILAQDRMCPKPPSSHYNLKFFYDLCGYFNAFFLKNKNIDTIIIDNTPHMSWDICMFYIAKKLNIRTLFLRKTGISGLLYIDEDFRPNFQNWNFSYKSISNPVTADKKNNDSLIKYISDNSFTKDQIGGAWPKLKKESLLRKFINLLKFLGLNEVVHLVRIFIKKIPNNNPGATYYSKQITTYAGISNVSRINHFLIHRNYIRKQKQYIKYYNDISKSLKFFGGIDYIYFPLHLQPERTTLPEGMIFNDQVLAIRLLSEAIPENWKIIIKEHPKQHLYDLRGINSRDRIDYKRISNINKVLIVPVAENHFELIRKSKMTATISGSVSWEGLIEGKPSLTFSRVWHSQCKSTKYVDSVKNIKSSIAHLSVKNKQEILEDVCNFIYKTSRFYIHGGLNQNHIKMFFNGNENISNENISKALLERIYS